MLLLQILFSFFASAAPFSTSYISLDLPQGWVCQKTQKEYICRNRNAKLSREAFFVLRAKLKARDESVNQFLSQLSRPKNYIDGNKKPAISKVISSGTVPLNGINWINALHDGGELKNFYSHYYATVAGDLAVLVIFTAHNKVFNKYKNQFQSIANSLKLRESLLTQDYQQKISGPQSLAIDDVEIEQAGFLADFQKHIQEAKENNRLVYYIGGVILLFGMLIFILK